MTQSDDRSILPWSHRLSPVLRGLVTVVAGILCGIVWMIGSVVSKTQEDWIAEARQEDAWVKYAQQDDPWSRGPEDPASSQTPTPSSAPREANDPAGRTWKH